jgi:hydrogenase nickel incorporation protein HypB
MCGTCGCSTTVSHTVSLEQKILSRNDHLASHNRSWLAERGILAVNLMSSPGSGKTTLLEHTIHQMAGLVVSVVEGDQETNFDADRIRATGCRVVQINTGAGCHLDAGMIAKALTEIEPPAGSVLFIENVGNLVCPALFDLGESRRVVIMSVTEGADKPLKYPHMFRAADLVLLNKIDLLPYVDFPVGVFTTQVAQVNPHAEILQVSATQGTGMASWCSWLHSGTASGLSHVHT